MLGSYWVVVRNALNERNENESKKRRNRVVVSVQFGGENVWLFTSPANVKERERGGKDTNDRNPLETVESDERIK